MPSSDGTIHVTELFKEDLAAELLKKSSAELNEMFRSGGKDREIAALEVGRRAANREIKNARKRQ